MALDDDQKESKTNHATHVWFLQPLFARLEDNHNMDTEVELSMRKLRSTSAGDNSGMMVYHLKKRIRCESKRC